MPTNGNGEAGFFDVPPATATEQPDQSPNVPETLSESGASTADYLQQADPSSATSQGEGVTAAHLLLPPTQQHTRTGRSADGNPVAASSAYSSKTHPVAKEPHPRVQDGQSSVGAGGFQPAETAVSDNSVLLSPVQEEEQQRELATEVGESNPLAEGGDTAEVNASVDLNNETTAVTKVHELGSNNQPNELQGSEDKATFTKGEEEPNDVLANADAFNGDVNGAQHPAAVLVEGEKGRDFSLASPTPQPVSAAAARFNSHAWVVDFGTGRPKPKRKMTKKEKDAVRESQLRCQAESNTVGNAIRRASHNNTTGTSLGADSEGNAAVADKMQTGTPLHVVQLDGLADPAAQIPLNLTTTRADLEQRLVLRLPRLLCVNKQYPRGCGIAALTSVYNYLYSRLGESAVGAPRAPHSQEELMSILGFEPPFGEIAWGPFTGNTTLIRWFHALNRHFGLQGRAYILYKAHGQGKTTHLYPDNAAALVAVKAALRDPHCALIYHCHNHYMVPIGYQEIPHAQTDFLKSEVPKESCDTTIFIGEVSRGRHEAMYARKWEQVVKDIECKSPYYFNIRHPEQGVQKREPKKKKTSTAEAVLTEGETQAQARQQENTASALMANGMEAAVAPADTSPPPPTLFIPMPASLRSAAASAPRQHNTTAENGSNEREEEQDEEVSVAMLRNNMEEKEGVETPVAETAGNFAEATGPHNAAQPSRTPAVHVTVDSAFSSRLLSSTGEDEDMVEVIGIGKDRAGDAAAPQVTTYAPAVYALDGAEPAEPSANLVTQVGYNENDMAWPPLCESAKVGAATVTSLSSLPVTANPTNSKLLTDKSPISQAPFHAKPRGVFFTKTTKLAHLAPAATSAAAKPQKERGNMNCLIIFRNDQVEERLDRYEETAVEEEEAAVASAFSGDGSSGSEEDAG